MGANQREFLKLAALGITLVFLLGGFTGSYNSNPYNKDGLVSLSFFHAEGRDIVADLTGEKVAFRGVNLNGLEFGTFFENPYPGEEGTYYFKPRPEDFDDIKALGFNVIRVPFEWARFVPGWQATDPLPTALDATYLGILSDAVQMAAERGLYVILDMHDFLKYWSGQSAQVCVDTSSPHQQLLEQTWKLLAVHFQDNPGVLGYDIMNQPVRLETGEPCGSCNWHAIAQSVVDIIRTVDENHLIFVEGPNFSLASDWQIENDTAFITDSVRPSRIVYSPHVFLDFNNDSKYDQEGEETGPVGPWEYYVRDRLLPVINWFIDNDVPVFFGETNVPCTPGWADVLDYAFRIFFEPLHLSVTAWHYINPARASLEESPLNLLACPGEYQLGVLIQYPGGPYQEVDSFTPMPMDSRLFDDRRVNPWDAGEGFFGDLSIDFCALNPVSEGDCSMMIHFNQDNFAGVKFTHHYGIDTRQSTNLRFWIYPTDTTQLNFRIFTTAPQSDCEDGEDPVYPSTFEDQPELRSFLPSPTPGQWQEVVIPLDSTIVNPNEPILNGIAFQNTGMSQGIFYLDSILFTSLNAPVLVSPPDSAEDWTGRPMLSWSTIDGADSYEVHLATDVAFENLIFRQAGLTDTTVDAGVIPYSSTYFWRVRAIRAGLASDWSALWSFTTGIGVTVEQVGEEIPMEFSLSQNYPNPFNPTTEIRFALPRAVHVTLTIYNLMGQEVATLVSGHHPAGRYTTTWDAIGFASGVYVYQLRTGTDSETRKMLLLK